MKIINFAISNPCNCRGSIEFWWEIENLVGNLGLNF
jgi:hypothetical protein